MQDFPANSAKVKARPEGLPQDDRPSRIKQVTSAEAKVRRRGLGSRFKETFVGGSARGAFDYMIMEVVIPAIQDTLIDAFQGGIERLIKGDHSRPRRSMNMGSSYASQTHVNYQGMSSNKPTTRSLSQQARSRHDFGEIVIQNRVEAEEVLELLYEELSRYGEVKVAVLYELTGIQSSHVDHKWGWTSLRGARATRLRDGQYLLNLPAPEPLDR